MILLMKLKPVSRMGKAQNSTVLNPDSFSSALGGNTSKNDYYLLGFLLAFSFLIRALNLDAVSLWIDEFVHVGHAQRILNEGAPIFGVDDNGILYTLFVIPFFTIFGETAFWARFPSVLFGTGSILVTWMLAKEIYNKPVAYISAFITSFSLYHIYWSRLSRNYAIFSFFFLLLVYVLFKAITFKNPPNNKNHLERKYLIALPFIFIASLLSHVLTVVSIFALAIYFLVDISADLIIKRKVNVFRLLLGICSLIFLLLILTPLFSGVLNSFLGFFLPPHVVGMISLDWSRIILLWSNNPMGAFMTFWQVLFTDLSYTIILGIIGMLLSFLWNKKHAWFHTSMFLVPLLLMSFIFREPNEPRYLLYIYPLFIIYIGVATVTIFNAIKEFFIHESDNLNKSSIALYGLTIFLLIAAMGNVRQVKDLVKAKQKAGNIVYPELSSWFFVNWKEVYRASNDQIQKEDIVFSTVPSAARFYLDKEKVFGFRQYRYSGQSKSYVMNPPSRDSISAATLPNLKRTVQENPRGWLFANYYLYNVVTDPEARSFVYNNFKFRPELSSSEADIQVFSWDKNTNTPSYQNVIVHLGRYRRTSEQFAFNVGTETPAKSLSVKVEGIDYLGEAYIILNNNFNKAIPIPPNKTKGIEQKTGEIDPGLLIKGRNVIHFYYNHREDNNKAGFIIYQLQILDN